ncbi:MAG: hypothetical protein ACI38Q_06265 [Candidatus Bruticola sp.]
MWKKCGLLAVFVVLFCFASACSSIDLSGGQDEIAAEYSRFLEICQGSSPELWQHLSKGSRRMAAAELAEMIIMEKNSNESPEELALKIEQKLNDVNDTSYVEGLSKLCKNLASYYYDLSVGKNGTAIKVDGDYAEVVNSGKMKYLEFHKEDGVWKAALFESRKTTFSDRHFSNNK